MEKINFFDCKNEQEIEARIAEALKYKTVVAPEDVESWFSDAGIEGHIFESIELDEDVSIWDEEHQGEVVWHVRICSHYVDAGSDDYIYSYTIS